MKPEHIFKIFGNGFEGLGGWKMALIWGVALILWCWNWTHPRPSFLGREIVSSAYGWEWVPDYHDDSDSDDNEDDRPPNAED